MPRMTFPTLEVLLMLERDIAKSGPTSNPVTGGGVCISNVFPLIRGKKSGLRVKLFRLPFFI